MKNILCLISLFLLIGIGAVRAPASEPSPADRDWQAIEALLDRRAEPPAGSTPFEKQKFIEHRLEQRRELGLAFFEKYPRDPRRWIVVSRFDPSAPRFVKNWGPLNENGFAENPETDAAAAAVWRQKVMALKAELAQATDVPEELLKRGAQAKAELAAARKEREAFLARFRQGNPAPDFIMIDPAGREVKLADFRGKVLVLDFWATWCGPCMAAMPHTQEAAARYKDQGVIVLGSCTRDTRANFEKWVAKNQGKYPDILWAIDPLERSDECASKKLYGVPGIPAQIVIDREGRMVDVTLGGSPDGCLLDAALVRAGIKVEPARLERAEQLMKQLRGE